MLNDRVQPGCCCWFEKVHFIHEEKMPMAHGRRQWPIDEGYAAVEEGEAPYNFWDFKPRMGSYRLNGIFSRAATWQIRLDLPHPVGPDRDKASPRDASSQQST